MSIRDIYRVLIQKPPGVAKLRRCVAASLAVLMLASSGATAAFVNGVETFAGSTPDTATWTAYPGFGASNGVTQNNGITLDSSTQGSPDITAYGTTAAVVGVGQGVAAQVSFGNYNRGAFVGSVYLMLMDRPLSSSTLVWSNERDIQLNGDENWFNAGAAMNGDGSGTVMPSPPNYWLYYPPPAGQSWTMEIDRPSLESAVFSLYDSAHALQSSVSIPDVRQLLSQPPDLTPFPQQMYVVLYTQSASATFTRVTIVPEPALAGIVCLAVLTRRRS